MTIFNLVVIVLVVIMLSGSLCRAVRRQRFYLTDLTLLRRRFAEMEKLSLTDSLTGLPNRRSFEGSLKCLISSMLVKGEQRKVSVHSLNFIFLDIDKFKTINDHWGHLVGDIILKEVSFCIRKCLRETDLVCRWGGEEIGVVLINADSNYSQKIAEKIRVAVSSCHFHEGVKVTVSIGVSYASSQEESVTLVDRADKALYEAKSSGRNKVVAAEAISLK